MLPVACMSHSPCLLHDIGTSANMYAAQCPDYNSVSSGAAFNDVVALCRQLPRAVYTHDETTSAEVPRANSARDGRIGSDATKEARKEVNSAAVTGHKTAVPTNTHAGVAADSHRCVFHLETPLHAALTCCADFLLTERGVCLTLDATAAVLIALT